MPQAITIRTITGASAIAAISAIAMFSSTGSASAAKNTLACDGGSRVAVVECCQQIVKKTGLPIWMKRAGKDCQSQRIQCRPSTAIGGKYCRYVYLRFDDNGGGPNPHNGGRGSRGGSTGKL